MNNLQEYMVYEYVADYKAGHLSRRDLIRRVLYMTGGVASTATLLSSLGCSPSQQPAPTSAPAAAPKPTTAPAASPAASPSAAGSPSAVAKPAVSPAASPSALAAASPVASPSPVARSPLSVPANDPSIEGQDISFPGNGTTLLGYQARPSGTTSPLPLILVVHQNRGLNEHIRDVVRRYAKEGYIAFGLDLLSREGGTDKITDPNQFGALLTNVDVSRHVADFNAAVQYYKGKPDLVQADKMGMNGFCFGGGVVWRSVEAIPELKGAAPFYGAPPPLDQVGQIKAAVLGVYSSDPQDFANNGRDALDQALTQANITHKFNVYPGTMHAFNDDTGPAYNQQQALQAWQDTLAWFGQYVKG